MSDVAVPVVYQKKRKKQLRAFEVLTRIELNNSSSKEKPQQTHYTIDESTNEVYILSAKCSHCGSVEDDASSSSATTTAAPALVHDGVWLSDVEMDEIVKRQEGEKCHQRRYMYEEEIRTRKVRNKLKMLDSLRIYNASHQYCEEVIGEALKEGKVSVNANAFLITEDDELIPYTKKRGGCEYELIRNKHELESITKQRLFEDMLRHQDAFKQLVHVFHFLENHPYEYIIYKRKIELVDSLLIDTLNLWDRLERLFIPNVEGYYYAIVVCLGFSLGMPVVMETTECVKRKQLI